jgi:hypothetical protein
VPFSAYLIGRLANPTGYDAQFNLDSDRAYAYLTWDWIRGDQLGTAGMGIKYRKPVVPPQGDTVGWDGGTTPMQLRYVDPPSPPIIIGRQGDPDGEPR